MKCFHPRCTVSMATNGALFRINDKGQDAIWACRDHMKNTDAAPVDPIVSDLVNILQGQPKNGSERS